MQVILRESNFNTFLNILRVQLHFKWHGHFLLSPNLGLQQLFIGITDFLSETRKPSRETLKNDFSNLHRKQTTKQLPLSEWSGTTVAGALVPVQCQSLILHSSERLVHLCQRRWGVACQNAPCGSIHHACAIGAWSSHSWDTTLQKLPSAATIHTHLHSTQTMCWLYKTTKNKALMIF